MRKYFFSYRVQAKHVGASNWTWGVNGETGEITDMRDLGVWEPLAVKLQTYKTAAEVYVAG